MNPLRFLPKQLLVAACLGSLGLVAQAAPGALFDGKTLQGWEGETAKTWRMDNGEIVAGSPNASAG